MVKILGLSQEKKFHRFFNMSRNDFFFPINRSEKYTIIEIIMFKGRSLETKKKLIKSLIERIHNKLEISKIDIEIVIIESPNYNWGIRGVLGDELSLNYKVEV
ncbi:MAG: tautomerase family protein [Candidatus Lokiarchaeota archaeon]|nr:tautomerase family protein [Candidatus Lokiarchaeota archaeon]